MIAVFALAWPALAAPLDPSDFVPLGVFAPAGAVTVDTDLGQITGSVTITGVTSNGVAVFAFDDVQIDVAVTVLGSKPVAFLSRGDLRMGPGGSIDAAALGLTPGPGGYPGGEFNLTYLPCDALSPCPEILGGGPGGGGVDVFGAGGGGHGGSGGGSGGYVNCITPGNSMYLDPSCSFISQGGESYGNPVDTLQGGSGGANPGVQNPLYLGYPLWAYGGGGGGAIELGALGSVTIDGVVDVRGGDAATAPPYYCWPTGGGGGGAGGAVLVHGRGGTLTGSVLAPGGAGGVDGCGTGPGGGGGGGWVVLRGLDAVTGVIDVSGGPGAAASGLSFTNDSEGGQPGVVVVDTDADGLEDGDETAIHGTDPSDPDTDNGGRLDGTEIELGLDPFWGGDDLPPSRLTLLPGPSYGVQVFEASNMAPGFPVTLVSGPLLNPAYELSGCSQPTPGHVGPLVTLRDTRRPVDRVATLYGFTPLGSSGTRYFVAVQPASCRVSDVVTITLP